MKIIVVLRIFIIIRVQTTQWAELSKFGLILISKYIFQNR